MSNNIKYTQTSCIRCGDKFKAWDKKNKAKRKHCFNCVPFGVNANKHLGNNGKTFKCKRCDKEYIYKREATHGSTSYCNQCRKRIHNQRYKLRAVEYKGGKCTVCGFKKFVTALTFHHIDPGTKSFGISEMLRHPIGWEKLRKELDKCVLLCQNCHAGIHAGDIDLNKYI